jgi:hypothetical protein
MGQGYQAACWPAPWRLIKQDHCQYHYRQEHQQPKQKKIGSNLLNHSSN